MSETVVLDSTNLAAVIADATGEPESKPEGKPEAKAEAKADAKAEAKAETKVEEKPKPKAKADPDGLTEEERKTYTESMRKSIAWRHGKMREAQEAAERERQGRMAAEEKLKSAMSELEALKVQPRSLATEAPKRESFPDDEAYQAALIDYRVEQRFKEKAAAEAKAREEQERQAILARASKLIARAKELVPDFEEVTSSVDLAVPAHVAEYIQESELFAELGYYFAQHPDELERIARMPARTRGDVARVGVALGKIESMLEPFGSQPKVEANGASPKPSTEADGIPSKPRVSVPVLQPLSARGAPEVETREVSGRQAVSSFERRTGVNLTRRARH